MNTIALRFADTFAPNEGTVAAHQKIIDTYGFVWYGKKGIAVSDAVLSKLITDGQGVVLLIHSGHMDRYWAYIDKAQKQLPDKKYIPEYYRDNTEPFKTWFRIVRFDPAPGDILSRCVVPSSGNTLSYTSRRSMSPYYIIECDDPRSE